MTALPHTARYRLLTRGDTIQPGDQHLHDDCESWIEIKGWPVGGLYSPSVMVPMRRPLSTATGEGA